MVIVVAGTFTAGLRENRYVGGKVAIRAEWGRKYLSVDISLLICGPANDMEI